MISNFCNLHTFAVKQLFSLAKVKNHIYFLDLIFSWLFSLLQNLVRFLCTGGLNCQYKILEINVLVVVIWWIK